MNNDLRKNAEGYTDPTASATLTRKETADIWTYRDGECLIIKCHPGHATILRLHDVNQYGGRVKVADRDDGPRYVDPTFVISGRYHEMGRYVETLDADTFEEVLCAVEAALDINLQTSGPDTQDVGAEVEALRGQLVELKHQHNLQKAELDAANRAAEKARNQLELLREMYNDLLVRIVTED